MVEWIKKWWKWLLVVLGGVLTLGFGTKMLVSWATGDKEKEAAKEEGKAEAFEVAAKALDPVLEEKHQAVVAQVQEAMIHVGAQEVAESKSAAVVAETKAATDAAGDDVDKLAKLLD